MSEEQKEELMQGIERIMTGEENRKERTILRYICSERRDRDLIDILYGAVRHG